ncbi:hypothetical protein [Clostridium sp.]|uniref:hypothetical protein n=1 Tax=Clostridium sp. TaxID=1506 RepID=UPI003F3308F2
MKIAIDINNEEVLLAISNEFKRDGNLVVDLSYQQGSNRGETVFKKALLANTTRVDFFVGIKLIDDEDIWTIYHDDSLLSKNISLKIRNELVTSYSGINYNNGSNYYLLKNTNAPAIYLKVPSSIKNDLLKKIEIISKAIINDN